MPCVIVSTWVWAGFRNLPLVNTVWQRWWAVTSKIRLPKDCGFDLAQPPLLSLTLSPFPLIGASSHVVSSLRNRLTWWELISLATLQGGPEPAYSYVSELENDPSLVELWDATAPVTPWLKLWRDPWSEAPVKPHLYSLLRNTGIITVYCTLLSFG